MRLREWHIPTVTFHHNPDSAPPPHAATRDAVKLACHYCRGFTVLAAGGLLEHGPDGWDVTDAGRQALQAADLLLWLPVDGHGSSLEV